MKAFGVSRSYVFTLAAVAAAAGSDFDDDLRPTALPAAWDWALALLRGDG